MNHQQVAQFCAWSLGIVFLCSSPACAQPTVMPVIETTQGVSQEYSEVLQDLLTSNVVYLGETHDSQADHQAQLEIITALHQKHPNIVIAMEMFQRPFQEVIDQYLQGQMSEAELVQQSEYETRWGFPWELYAPIMQFAKENQMPVLALNTPSEVTRKVARQGLESLTETEQQYIPPFSEIRTDNSAYRQLIQSSFEQHQSAGHGSSADFDRFFLAQVLWDETMAETIAEFVKINPDALVVVLAGQGHIIYGYGIPSRVERRLQPLAGTTLKQRLVLLNSQPDLKAVEDREIADYFWKTEGISP
jgi:uncharacterized iron-regulated protein